jgi:hypothetical protein
LPQSFPEVLGVYAERVARERTRQSSVGLFRHQPGLRLSEQSLFVPAARGVKALIARHCVAQNREHQTTGPVDLGWAPHTMACTPLLQLRYRFHCLHQARARRITSAYLRVQQIHDVAGPYKITHGENLLRPHHSIIASLYRMRMTPA